MITEEYTEDGKFKWSREDKVYYGDEIKEMVIGYYGGRCVWCGIDDHRVLVIDHLRVKGDPKRVTDMNGIALHKWIIRKIVYGDIDKSHFRVLCHNCNHLAYQNNQENPGDITWGKLHG